MPAQVVSLELPLHVIDHNLTVGGSNGQEGAGRVEGNAESKLFIGVEGGEQDSALEGILQGGHVLRQGEDLDHVLLEHESDEGVVWGHSKRNHFFLFLIK